MADADPDEWLMNVPSELYHVIERAYKREASLSLDEWAAVARWSASEGARAADEVTRLRKENRIKDEVIEKSGQRHYHLEQAVRRFLTAYENGETGLVSVLIKKLHHLADDRGFASNASEVADGNV